MIYDYFKERKKRMAKKTVKKVTVIFIVAVIVIILAVIASKIYLEIIQLDEISNKMGNYSSVFLKDLFFRVISFFLGFSLVFLAFALMTKFIKRNLNEYVKSNELESRFMPNLPIAALAGLFGGIMAQNVFYTKILSFINYVPFGTTDPIFSKDIGYYIFQRPFLLSIYEFVLGLWVFACIYTVIYYVAVLATYFTNFSINDLKIKSIIVHNLVNVSILFIIKAFSYKFQSEGLVYSSFLDLKGAGYVDVNVWMKYFTAAPFILVAIVIIAFILIRKNKLKNAAITIAVFPAIWIIVALIAGIFQQFVVKPNALYYEKQYIKYNMQQTRNAFGVDGISSYEFPKMKDLTPEIINRNIDTKNNIRIVDYEATLRSNIQLQSNTNFYTFQDGDIINYKVNGQEIPVFITAREIDKNKLSEQQRTYINTRFKYTHGYGVVVNPINKLTAQGQVDFLLSGLRMDTVDEKNLSIKEPKIYYGEMTNDSVIVNPPGSKDKEKEIDYDGNKTTNYNGNGGIKLNLLNRLLFSINENDFNMFISGNITGNSKILLNRNIIKRAQRALPFLSIDSDPYMVISSDGKLKWVLDAYTATENYPYSQDYGSINYIRNSVKITVDAYNGNVECYIIDKNDTILKSYDKMYPGVFIKGKIPDYVADHMRYPETLFKIQTEILRRYHIDPNSKGENDNISIFFTNQDTWNIAKYPDPSDSGGVVDIDPYYNMIKLPLGVGKTEELILMRPYTPSGDKHNMVSWLAVRNSKDDYGEMIMFNFPKNTNILGTDQVEVNINQITEISEAMTLLGQGGSRVFKGSLLVIPIEDSVLYVEPIYIQSKSMTSIPQVRKVVVGYQKGNDFKHGVGNTLDEALSDLFKDSDTSIKPIDQGNTQGNTNGENKKGIDKETAAKIKAILNELKKNNNNSIKRYNELMEIFDEMTN